MLYNLYLRAVIDDSMFIGKIIAIGFFIQALIFVPAGVIGDKLGTKRALLIGVICLTIGFWSRGFAMTELWLVFWTAISSVGMAILNVSFTPVLTEYSYEKERVSLFSTAFSSGTFATFIGTLLGGIFTDLFSFSLGFSEILSLRLSLCLAALIGTVSIFPGLLLSKRMVLENRKPSIFGYLKNDRGFLNLIYNFGLSKLLMGVSIGLTFPFINLFLADRYSASTSLIGLVIAVATLGTVVAMTQTSRLVRAFGNIKSVIIIQLLSIPFVLILGFSSSLLLVSFSLVLYRSFKYASGPIEAAIVMAKVDPSVKGLANSIGWMALTVGTGVVGPFTMYLVTRLGFYWGYNLAFLLSAIVSIFALLLFRKAFHLKPQLKNVVKEVVV